MEKLFKCIKKMAKRIKRGQLLYNHLWMTSGGFAVSVFDVLP